MIQAFNSLSRDHFFALIDTRHDHAVPPFNSLSRDHRGEFDEELKMVKSVRNFQLPLSGSQHYYDLLKVFAERYDHLSTPSLGITIS